MFSCLTHDTLNGRVALVTSGARADEPMGHHATIRIDPALIARTLALLSVAYFVVAAFRVHGTFRRRNGRDRVGRCDSNWYGKTEGHSDGEIKVTAHFDNKDRLEKCKNLMRENICEGERK